MKKYYNLNYNKEKKEMKINKLENEYQRKKSYVTIYDYNKFYKKLIHLKKKEDLENLEFQELLFKLKYYKTLKEKESIINVLKKNNNKVKLSKNKFIQ
jgi:mevalonate kinase